MKNLAVLALLAMLAGGCVSSFGSMDHGKLVSAGANAYQAATLSEEDAKNLAINMRRQEDAKANVAPANSPYTKRLNKLMAHMTSVNGMPLSYKVYMTDEVNANAAPDGSVRVYSGLMDKMNDDELRFVLGHEIGHVALGHSLKAMRMAYGTEAARQAAGSMNYGASVLSDSQLGNVAKAFVNAQFSQSQESDADAYGMKFLKENNYNTSAAGSALRKLASGNGQSSTLQAMFSSHPEPAKRAAKMDQLAAQGN